MELQHLANTLKNLQRAKQDVEDNLNRSLREKDSIITQLQLSLEGKTKDMEVSYQRVSPPQTLHCIFNHVNCFIFFTILTQEVYIQMLYPWIFLIS